MTDIGFDRTYLWGEVNYHGGSVYYRDGGVRYVNGVLREGDNYLVRIEDGWYNEHAPDGRAISSGAIVGKDGSRTPVRGRDIVKFIARSYEEHKQEHGNPWEYEH